VKAMRKDGEYRFPFPRPVWPFAENVGYTPRHGIIGLRVKDGLPQWCYFDDMRNRVLYKDGKEIHRIPIAQWEEFKLFEGGKLIGTCRLWRMAMYYLKDPRTKFVKATSPDECTKDFRDLDEVAKEYRAEKAQETIDIIL
ncbi:MAG: hypothetical protein J5733_03060, partial [Bacteroidaceae bacterium]|nr:hypothetical protein [Bacteroidaceae bacterium]